MHMQQPKPYYVEGNSVYNREDLASNAVTPAVIGVAIGSLSLGLAQAERPVAAAVSAVLAAKFIRDSVEGFGRLQRARQEERGEQ